MARVGGAVEPLRVGFVGIAHPHARAWAAALARTDQAIISSAYDRSGPAARAFAQAWGATTRDVPDFVGLDAVIVDGRNVDAVAAGRAAVAAGLPVLIEKPGGTSGDALAGLAEAAAAADVPTQLGYFLRYSDVVERAAELLQSGALGQLTLARFRSGLPHTVWSGSPWFTDPDDVRSGLLEAGCHVVDVLRLLLGEPLAVVAASAPSAHPGNPGEGALAAVLQYDDFIAVIEFDAHESTAWNTTWGFELSGTRGSVRATFLPPELQYNDGTREWAGIVRRAGGGEAELAAAASREDDELMDRALAAFIRTATRASPSPVDAADGARTMRLIERIHQAARERADPRRLTRVRS